ncbi:MULTISPECIES: septum site-determining protein MinC [Burkholderiaceae]|uniref:septum site-determining protein MinC n=1 Tax=Burkholderiaceae TaxID=119060 RepID=UPI00095F3369|nr:MULTISPECIES: septum site-determining protein MinC [Burkholderiaceae]MCG1038535.1 septum site-determining protein MinC [Mycetohabitans sp. B7]SIT80471.1 septum site-determining protein MinC [Burkholderia sp. b14]
MSAKKSPFFELRSGTLDTLLFIVKTTDLAEMRAELSRRFDATPEFFANDVVAIDLRRLPANQRVPVAEVAEMLKAFRMHPAGIVANDAQRPWAQLDALPFVESRERRVARSDEPAAESPPQAASTVPQATSCDMTAKPQSDAAADTERGGGGATLVIDKPLRSGQQVYAKGDLVVLGLVSYGAEVIAEGNIHIYAPLRGRALAGVHGNHGARIFCTCLEPELISIAGIYRTTETPLGSDVLGKSVQIWLADEKLIIEPLRLT